MSLAEIDLHTLMTAKRLRQEWGNIASDLKDLKPGKRRDTLKKELTKLEASILALADGQERPSLAAVRGKSRDAAAMTKWLTKMMHENPTRPIPKIAAHDKAVAAGLVRLPVRAFDRVWASVVGSAGMSAWSAPGRRKSSHLIATEK